MDEQMRKIEKIIDNYRKSSKVFSYTRPTAILVALRVFEDGCRLGASAVLEKTGDPVDYSMEIREQLNSIDTVLKWIFSECKPDTKIDIICDEHYSDFSKLNYYHARKYFGIYSAYVGYSRGKMNVKINEKQRKVSFKKVESQKNIVISNFTEALANQIINKDINNLMLVVAIVEFKKTFKVNENRFSYHITDEVWSQAKKSVERQWSESSELPLEWIFDRFSLKEFQDVWIAFGTWMWIHSFACLNSGIIGLALDDVVIVKKKIEVIIFISQMSGVNLDISTNIIDYLIYNPEIKNNDIIFQPLIPLFDDWIAISPHLFLFSRAERNLVMLMHKKKDKSYFKLTNMKENLMVTEISKIVLNNISNEMNTGVKLPGRLPDVDLVIYNKDELLVIICELKWLTEADATHEVYAREDDLNHGCDQVKAVLQYAMENPSDFMKRTFNVTISGEIKFGACVVSKNGIRTTSTSVPVISLSKFTELYNGNNSLRGLLDDIVAKKYLSPIPSNFRAQNFAVKYANYTFEIPAFVKYRKDVKSPYGKRKVGRNDLCLCGSNIKYKKCCGNLAVES